MKWCYKTIIVILLIFGLSRATILPDRPRLRTENGNLILETGRNRNISFNSAGGGCVNVNGIDITRSYALIESIRPQLQVLNTSSLGFLIRNLSRVVQEVSSQTHLAQTLTTIRTQVVGTTSTVTELQSSYQTIQRQITQLTTNVTRLNTQHITPQQSQLLQNFLNRIGQNGELPSAPDPATRQQVTNLRQRVTTIEYQISNLGDIEQRLLSLEATSGNSSMGSSRISSTALRRLKSKMRILRRDFNQLRRKVNHNNCLSNPCRNGGTCIDTTSGFEFVCLCPSGYEGANCDEDVNECHEFIGTDLGCQNGATCRNLLGSYSCSCASGWYGVHCTLKVDSCESTSSTEICGHGTCIPSARNGHQYTCICDQGWQASPGHPACTQDVNECLTEKPPCSHDPPVQCINTYGSFRCGPCPQGFEGNGLVCRDVDECSMNNGGCSMVPMVECINKRPGRMCGPCPPGYSGNGETCSPVTRPCLRNPCHPQATCQDNIHMSSSYFTCVCRPGFTGNGIGPSGCIPASPGGGSYNPTQNPCMPSPCIHGVCTAISGQSHCTCNPGFTGLTCAVQINPCASTPCLNGGTCTSPSFSSFRCSCPPTHTGDRCQTPSSTCGAQITGSGGVVEYPGPHQDTYSHNISCAFRISVHRDQVISLNFTVFHLEPSPSCRFDWLQIYDGPGYDSHLIGRFCGTRFPGVNGTILSTHNSLYLWFRSDHSRSGNGFAFTWNATDPVCGGTIRNQTHGAFNSPGYPGRYPANRDCYWTVEVTPGNKILFHFASVQIEHHNNCSYDYLSVYDGLTDSDTQLVKICSTQLPPPPVTSSSSEAMIHFHSDASLADTGFHVTFSSIPGIPGCGGLLTSDAGEFSPPTLNEDYHSNLQCEWLIRVPPREKIELNFTRFHVEYHRRCIWDFVEVRDGGERDSRLIGRFCGNEIPEPITSSSNKLFVRFASDHIVEHGGFTARYAVACGGEYTAASGVITSPYFPNNYPHNRLCYYILRQPPGKAILLSFRSFDLEDAYDDCRFDHLIIRDGLSHSSPLLGEYCGPSHRVPNLIASSLNGLYLEFKTDGSVTNKGFSANYSTIDIRCGGIHHTPVGTINSPNSPDSYPGNTDCRWVIDVPPQYVIQLTWHSFSLEDHFSCRFDYVEVFDNSSVPSTGGRIGSRFCGTSIPSVMTSTGNVMTIHFHSDHSANLDGFSAAYHTLHTDRVCGGHYHMSTGRITTPNYPLNYPNARTCSWTITVPVNHQIRLNFTDFDMESGGPSCIYDQLIIRNGGFESSPVIQTLCGNNKTVPAIFSHSHQLHLQFKSDDSINGRGFEVFWEETATGCGGTLTSPTGELTSPGYPQPYHKFASCIWRINVSKGSKISFSFIDLDFTNSGSCYSNFIEARDGLSKTSRLIGRYCSRHEGFVSFNTTNNKLRIKFKGGWTTGGRGFRARYFSVCNTELTGHRGVIESPNFPDLYPHDRNCTWVIKAPLGNSINASFSHFDVEDPASPTSSVCEYDYVEIRAGHQKSETPTRTMIGHFCGSRIPNPVFSGVGFDIMEVQFKSDQSLSRNGFRLEWVVHGCGGILTGFRGRFESPNYPNAYPVNTHCEWHIRVPVGFRIIFRVNNFDIESSFSSTDCTFDVLNVYGGPDKTSPLLLHLCHQDDSRRGGATQGNEALVTFESDSSVRGKGFEFTYYTEEGGCGGDFYSLKGEIHSPNYPENYNNGSDCVWRIGAYPNNVVELEFKDFDVEPDTNCSYDYVGIYDGLGIYEPLLYQFCGSSLPTPSIVRSTGRFMTVRLKADGNMEARGFKAEYRDACGATINVTNDGRQRSIQSPKFPGLVTPHTHCTWYLQSNEGYKIHLRFTHMNLQGDEAVILTNVSCPHNYVQVMDGDSESSPEIGRFCGTFIPRDLYSSAQYMTIRLHTNMVHGTGFSASFSPVDVFCGGELFSMMGEFASPEYPDSYPTSYECIWKIQAGFGNRIQLSFEAFDIEESDGCNLDYIEVHEGTDPSGSLLIHNCSSTIPPTITATGGFWVKFRSDDTGTASGFLAKYALQSSNDLTSDSGTISSPLYPHLFTARGEYVWTITVSPNKYISFEIEHISVEVDPVEDMCFSSLVIYDGFDDSSTVLKTLCGHTPPRSRIVTSGNVAFVKFISNYRHEGSLFKLHYNTVFDRPQESGIQSDPQGPHPNCSYVVSVNRSTYVASPNYPQNYDNNLNCQWIFETEKHSSMYLYIFSELEESNNCIYDRLEVYDGIDGTMNWNKTETICSRSQRYRGYRSTGSVFMVRFITDSSVTRKGFHIRVYKSCGGVLVESDGVITSPGFPSNYRTWEYCEWKIKAPLGKTIQMVFNTFKIANTTAICSNNYLLIHNGETRSSPFLGRGRYCGVQSIPQIPETSSNNALIIFRTRSHVTAKGFHLTYHHVSTSCGGHHQLSDMLTSITITSPNYPNPPHPHTECIWIITGPSDKSLTLDFIDTFDIYKQRWSSSCTEAYVEVRNGGTQLSPLKGKYCGSTPPDTIKTDGIIYIRYVTNAAEAHAGFKAKIQIGKCGGAFRLRGVGYLTSPNYPDHYDNDANCTWHIFGPPGHYLIFNFLEINIYNPSENCTSNYGKLKIFDPLTNETEIICGEGKSHPDFETVANNATITFTNSKSGGTVNRFRLVVTASREVCGGTFTGSGGVIKSSGYPHGMNHGRYCTWKLHGLPGSRINLTIEDLDFSTSPYCATYLHVANGISSFSPHSRGFSCYHSSQVPISISSSMNTMKINLYNYRPSYSRGFKATWSSDEPQECGGTLEGSSGSVISPGYESGSYNHSMFCVWTLLNPNPVGTSMNITLHHLHLEHGCYDFIVFQGMDETDQVIDENKICQGEETIHFVLPYPSIKIYFVSDSSVTATGFNISYGTSNCGGYKTGPENNITSPGYATGSYPPNSSCAWLFVYPEGSQVEIEFTDFELEDSINHDFVKVFNGMGLSSPLIGQYSGTSSPGTVGPSMSNKVLVLFQSDSSTNKKGFTAVARAHTRGCGGIYHGIYGTFASPGFEKGENYPSNTECVWEVKAQSGYQITATFLNQFDLETSENCQNDFVSLSLYSEENGIQNWNEKMRKCGKAMPPPFQTNSSSFRFMLRTNDAIEGKGFKLQYVGVCGGIYSESEGYILSPNHPQKFPRNVHCNYKIDAPDEAYVVLNFTNFKVSRNYYGRCWSSKLTIQQKINGNNYRTVTTLCGSEIPDPMVLRGPVFLSFTSSWWVRNDDTGFLIYYTIKDCGGNVTKPGDISLPTHPGSYLHRMNCVWDIQAPEGKIIYIKFQILHLEYHPKCRYDYLDIFIGINQDPSKLKTRLCGDHTDALSKLAIAVPSSQSRIIFNTDESVSKPGFKASIDFTYHCGGVVNISEVGAVETIRSLDADNDGKYEPLLKCQWLVQGVENMVLAFNFTRLDIEGPGVNDTEPCPYDFVQIYDGTSEESPSLGEFCGSSLPTEGIIGSHNIMLVVFHSDSLNQTAGFTAKLTNMPTLCGDSSYIATSTLQALDSPNYPSHYPVSLRCRYVISSTAGKRIRIHFNEFSLEGSSKCTKDYVFVGELPDEDEAMYLRINAGPRERVGYPVNLGGRTAYFDYGTMLNHKYCGSTFPHHLESTTSKVEIQFKSDSSGTESGFRLHYSLATCNTTFTTESGQIYGSEKDGGNCFTTIRASSDHFVALYILRMRFNGSEITPIKIYDGESASSPVLRELQGFSFGEDPIYSTGNSLHIEVRNPPRKYKYQFSYSMSQYRDGCGGKFYGKINMVASPNYPGTPSGNMTCEYLIAVPHNFHAALRHIYMDFGGGGGCNYTYLEVYDVLPSNEARLFTTFCPGDEPARHLSPTNKMVLRYVIGTEQVTGVGWKAHVHAATPHQDTNFDEDTTVTSTSAP